MNPLLVAAAAVLVALLVLVGAAAGGDRPDQGSAPAFVGFAPNGDWDLLPRAIGSVRTTPT
jgi:hypothetical protein